MHLISVSSLLHWHAQDRVISGIKNYYENHSNENDIDVVFHIVGEGPEIASLKKLTTELNFEDKVIFHGFKINEELNKLFAQSHVAVGSLGHNRINLKISNTLKSREYFARGVPFILSGLDEDFPENLPYVKYIPLDESPVNIDSVIEFYKNISNNFPSYPSLIRKYAKENLTWDLKIKKVMKLMEN